jgi:RND family efflux transporter MFP subunit
VPDPGLRAVKIETVQSASVSTLHFLGTVRQHERADLSFESRGRVARVDVDVGDSVLRGQVLAMLDIAPANLRLRQAQANVSAALAEVAERRLQFEQQQALFADRTISSVVLESARVAYQTAVSQLQVTRSIEELARREVRHGAIVAPFDGRVVARTAQPFTDVSEGQVVLQVEGRNGTEIVAMLPTTDAAELEAGAPALARLGETSITSWRLALEHLSSRTDSGSLVQAIFRVDDPNARLQSGTIATVVIPDPKAESVPNVPADALLIGSSSREAHLFIYDSKRGRVTAREVALGEMRNGRVLIESGLLVGEQVVVAGAPFLADGQAVTVFQPTTRLSRR